MKLYFEIIVSFLAIGLFANTSIASELEKKFMNSYNSGKNLIIIFMPEEESKELAASGDGTYDDWSYYFLSWVNGTNRKTTEVYNLSSNDIGKKILPSFKPNSIYSTLYIKKGKSIIYAADPIVEAYVYKYIDAYFNDKEDIITTKDLIGTEIDLKKQGDSSIAEFLGLEILDRKIK